MKPYTNSIRKVTELPKAPQLVGAKRPVQSLHLIVDRRSWSAPTTPDVTERPFRKQVVQQSLLVC